RDVPAAEDMLLALVAEPAERACVEREQAAGRRLEPEPARREDAQDVTAREERPARDLLADLRRRTALVVAVVPLAEIVAHLRHRAEAGEAAGLGGPL